MEVPIFEFTEEYEPLLKEVREIANHVIRPRAKEIEESDEFPFDMADHLFKEGYLQILIPKELAGTGRDITQFLSLRQFSLGFPEGLSSWGQI